MSTILLNRNFFLLWQGQLTSQLGNQAFTIAIMFWAMEATGSGSFMGLLMMFSMLPMIMFGPIGGTIADWFERRTIIILSDFVSGAVVLLLAGAFFFSMADRLLVPVLFVTVTLLGVVRAFFQPAISAAIPDLVPEERVAGANSFTQFSTQVSTILGQSLGGILYRTLGAPMLFLIDGLSFLFSAVSEMFIRMPVKERRKKSSMQEALADFKRDTFDGLAYVWKNRGMRLLLTVASTFNFLVMPVFVLMPFYVDLRLGKGAAWYGFLLAAMSVGSIIGYVVAGTLKASARVRSWLLSGSLIGVSAMMVVLSAVTSSYAALAVIGAIGILSGMINISIMTIFQTRPPEEIRGRVMSLVITLSGGLAPLGMLLGGILGDLTGKNIPLIYALCGLSSMAVILTASLSRDFRRFLSAEPGGGGDPHAETAPR